jgi:cold shock CspA family protein
MQQIPGISITVFLNGKPLRIEKDGFFGKPKPSDEIEVEAQALPEPTTYAVTVDGKKNITLKKNHTPASTYSTYRFGTRVKIALNGDFHVEYPENNIRLIRVNPDGSTDIWQITIISQHNNFFLITEKTYTNCCFENQGQVVCPQFKHRKNLTRFLKDILKPHTQSLPPVSKYKKVTISANGLRPGTARVRFWNSAQGWGSLITPEGEARVHWSNVARQNRLTILYPGQTVKYEDFDDPVEKGRNTGFKRETLNVTPL